MAETKTNNYTCDAPNCTNTSTSGVGWMRVATSAVVGGKVTVKCVCPTHAPAVTAAVTK